MKVGKIMTAIQTDNNYVQKIARCKAKQVEYDQWDDEEGVRMMSKKINQVEKERKKFWDSDL